MPYLLELRPGKGQTDGRGAVYNKDHRGGHTTLGAWSR